MTINSDPWFYHRPQLCDIYGRYCNDTLFSRMVFLGSRRIGKTSFFLNDLSPHLIKLGMTPIYISMWGNKSSPHSHFAEQLADALDELSTEGAVKRLLNSQIRKLAVGNNIAKFEVEFTPTVATDIDLSNIKKLFDDLLKKAGGSKLVLILDEFQHLLTSKRFDNFQYSLRTILDTLGTRVTVIYTGSSRTGIKAAFEDGRLPFYQSASVQEFPTIDDGFLEHCTGLLESVYNIHIEQLELLNFWREIDCSPHWIIKLMREIVGMKIVNEKVSLDSAIDLIRESICEEERHTEIIQSMTPTDKAVLLLRCATKGIYSDEAFSFIKMVGGKATRSAVQVSDKKLQAKGFISILPNKKVISEVYGLINAIRVHLGVTQALTKLE